MNANFLGPVFSVKKHPYFQSVHESNLLEKDRYRLFYVVVNVTLVTIVITEIEILMYVNFFHHFSLITVITGILILLNFLWLNVHKKPMPAFLIYVISGTMMINYHSFFEGGIRNPGLIYLLIIILLSYFLMGKKAGRLVTIILIGDIIFIYYLTISGYIIYDPEYYNNNLEQTINVDLLVTLFTCLLYLFFISSFINNSIRSQFNQLVLREKDNLQLQRNYFQSEQKALRSQMNPHFIFNSLNTVQDFILKNEGQKALDYLSDFSLLMRKMLTNSNEPFILLSQEIDFLKKYIFLEQIRYENKFSYSFSIDESINENSVKIPPMLIQPVIENSIKHGISSLIDSTGEIILSFDKNEKFLIVNVEDNGAGFSNEDVNLFTAKSKKFSAIEITRDRLKYMENISGEKGKIVVERSKNFDRGTNVILWIPM